MHKRRSDGGQRGGGGRRGEDAYPQRRGGHALPVGVWGVVLRGFAEETVPITKKPKITLGGFG